MTRKELNARFWAIVDANWSYEEICALVDYCKRVEDHPSRNVKGTR